MIWEHCLILSTGKMSLFDSARRVRSSVNVVLCFRFWESEWWFQVFLQFRKTVTHLKGKSDNIIWRTIKIIWTLTRIIGRGEIWFKKAQNILCGGLYCLLEWVIESVPQPICSKIHIWSLDLNGSFSQMKQYSY